MSRVRISTTVDESRLARARKLAKQPDAQMIDRALQSLIDEIEAAHELRALLAKPYHDDPDLVWDATAEQALPYDGDIPAEVLKRARAKRRR